MRSYKDIIDKIKETKIVSATKLIKNMLIDLINIILIKNTQNSGDKHKIKKLQKIVHLTKRLAIYNVEI